MEAAMTAMGTCARTVRRGLIAIAFAFVCSAALNLGVGAVAPTYAEAYTGTAQFTVYAQGGWFSPYITLQQDKTTVSYKSFFSNKTATKKYYKAYDVYVDGKRSCTFKSKTCKIKLSKNGWHTIKVQKSMTDFAPMKTGYYITSNPSGSWWVSKRYKCS